MKGKATAPDSTCGIPPLIPVDPSFRYAIPIRRESGMPYGQTDPDTRCTLHKAIAQTDLHTSTSVFVRIAFFQRDASSRLYLRVRKSPIAIPPVGDQYLDYTSRKNYIAIISTKISPRLPLNPFRGQTESFINDLMYLGWDALLRRY